MISSGIHSSRILKSIHPGDGFIHPRPPGRGENIRGLYQEDAGYGLPGVPRSNARADSIPVQHIDGTLEIIDGKFHIVHVGIPILV